MMKQGILATPETLAVHAGTGARGLRPVMPPIYQTSTFSFENAAHGAALFDGTRQGYIYTRMGNPTVEALEQCVAALEGGHNALACSSGMAAIHTTLVALLKAGDHLICSEAVYGATSTLVLGRMARRTAFGSDVSTKVDSMPRGPRIVSIRVDVAP